MTRNALCVTLVVCVACVSMAIASVDRTPPALPRQFQAELAIVSHLTDPRQSYPPSRREMRVLYDYDNKLARADVLEGHDAGKSFMRVLYDYDNKLARADVLEGHDAGKSFVRRYDVKKEYMVKHGKYRKCERAYLGEDMPDPVIPFEQEFVGVERVRGRRCEHWTHTYANTRVHIYVEELTKLPIRLTEETVIAGTPTLMLTYDLNNLRIGAQVGGIVMCP
ncbi:hypothetical protein P43SY_005062 [Pythium insidiosum]|uniref:Uncharacterized protein n=1 Tax=Pythium insidiosum TaxID=114742 RepID=A0AAD5Q8L9_PYTIN|nr:hypothetical protein P43SY_005062 [Pythium insidiosum]